MLLGAVTNPVSAAVADENLGTRPRRTTTPRHRPGEVIVAFESATTLADVERAVKVVGGVSARRSRYSVSNGSPVSRLRAHDRCLNARSSGWRWERYPAPSNESMETPQYSAARSDT